MLAELCNIMGQLFAVGKPSPKPETLSPVTRSGAVSLFRLSG